MSAEVFAGMRSVRDIPADARVGDWGDRILYAYRDIYIFTAITSRLRREVVDDPEFNQFESDIPPLRAFLNMAGGAVAGDTILTVDSPKHSKAARIFARGMVVRVGNSPVSGELLFVTANPENDTQIEVARGKFGTVAGAIADDSALTVIGTASPDGAGSPIGQGLEPVKVTNRVQLFRNAYTIDATLEATKTRYGIGERQRRKQNALERHLLHREMTAMFGPYFQELDDEVGTDVRGTRGFADYMVTNRLDGSGAGFTYAAFKAWALPLSDTGKPRKVAFVGGTLFQAIQNMCEQNATMMLTPGVEKWGMRISVLETAGPDIELVKHPLLTRYYPGTGICLDLSLLTVCAMRDLEGIRDMRYRPNIQLPDLDGHKGEYLSQIGVKLGLEQAHGIIHDVTVYTHV